jgi:osmotically-inducible protein OsmY
MFSALSLATLLLACAHDAKNQRAHDESTAAQRAEGNAERAEERAERADERAERRADNQERRAGDDDVDLPRRRGDRDRVASTEGVPGRREPAREQAEDSEGKEKVSSFDQGNNEIDLDLTQRIRKAVMDDDALSFKAKNVKIITRDGQVTLRGEVKTAAEKDAIYKCAVSAAGVGKVQNQIEVGDD